MSENHDTEKVRRLRALLAEAATPQEVSLLREDTLGNVLRAAAPWGRLLSRAILVCGWLAWSWWNYSMFRYNHSWTFISWTYDQGFIRMTAQPFLVGAGFGVVATIMIFLVTMMVREVQRRRLKRLSSGA
ncbi:hypothetical protein [Dyella lutea]|uniref:Uncharacterized protein n=1 Tax=Dyella lutea TaxID=2950441 RepID=A0ABT1FGV1_9GAMM|nr:hypothetical protein [Dyella lutea]MCP1375348.1 hypothetical protein [Dyella lutea]